MAIPPDDQGRDQRRSGPLLLGIGVAFLTGAVVSEAVGGWWAWPGLAAVGLCLLVGHVRLRAVGGRPQAEPLSGPADINKTATPGAG
jgi:hypothetical protein